MDEAQPMDHANTYSSNEFLGAWAIYLGSLFGVAVVWQLIQHT